MTTADRVILDRFREKCAIAGGPRTGYVLRKGAILYVADDHPGIDLEAGLASLVEQQILKANEEGNFYFLTEAGVEKLSETAS